MKLNEKFLFHSTEDESVLVPTGGAGFSGVVHGNRSLGEILALLKTETSESKIVAEMRSRFDAADGVVEQDVAHVLSELRKIGALDE